MSGETIKQLALSMKVPVDRLLTQLSQAGMSFSDPEQVISSTEKMKLLGFLRRSHGKDAPAESEGDSPRQITLKRSTRGELKLSTPGGRGAATGGAKTVNVEVRAKRTYVKRSAIAEEAGVDVEREEAVRKLQASQQQREQEEQEQLEAERRRQEEAQQRALDEQQRQHEKAQRQAEAAAAAAAVADTAAPVAAPEPVAGVVAADNVDDVPAAVQRMDQRDLGTVSYTHLTLPTIYSV